MWMAPVGRRFVGSAHPPTHLVMMGPIASGAALSAPGVAAER